MAFCLAQAGTTLYKVNLATGVATALTLPSGVTLSSTRKPKFAVLNQWVVMVNSPSQNLSIDPEGNVRLLVPRPPAYPIRNPAGGGSGLTGAYRYGATFIIKNEQGDLLVETPMSPLSQSITFANNDANLKDIPLSNDTITGRRVYRTLSGGDGSLLYQIFDVDDNVTHEIRDNVADAVVSLLPSSAGDIISPPGTMPGERLKNIVEWKSRLWAVSDDPTLTDAVFVTETNKIYAWNNQIVAYPTGQDRQGVVGFGVRRNQLGLFKRNGLFQVSGTASSTGISFGNLTVSQIVYGKGGCESAETIITINDKVFWLGRDGVYRWDDNGVVNITNASVAAWFKTDSYFNRTLFSSSFARYNELRNQYELHLAGVGSSTVNKWISFNLDAEAWFGPHTTDAFVPSHAGHLVDSNGLPVTLVGGTDGVLYTGNSANFRDGSASIIDIDCYGPFHHGDAPDTEHQWLDVDLLSKIEAAGTVTITPYVGGLTASAGVDITADLTKGRERLRRLGPGRLARLRFRQNTLNQGFSLFGYEFPYFEIGRR